ncbi:MAG: Rpn family recombination-promoting nuclease/putative transposase, partial [Planctomycetota bacterium]
MLQPLRPITSVEILNPILERDRSDAKLAILDVLAQDADDRRYNIEMQTTLPVDLRNRLTYYNCLNYVRQLSSGNPYHHLRPSISICVLARSLFADVPDYHLSFRLRCDQRELVFSDDLLFHTLELPKYVVPGDNALRDLPSLE